MLISRYNLKMTKRIYADTAASTPLDPKVASLISRVQRKFFANPSSLHYEGVIAKNLINEAREKMASRLRVLANNILFTASGTEANNLAIFGIANLASRPAHIIVSPIEHKSILLPANRLTDEGFLISVLPTDKNGSVSPQDLKEALRPETILVSIGYANNETGVIQPIADLAKVIRRFKKKNNLTNYPYFHIDACQAPRSLSLDVPTLGVDLMTLDGAKIYGPKGIGALVSKVPLKPLILGGNQEFGLRAGTENTAAIVGLNEALSLAISRQAKDNLKLRSLTEYLWLGIQKNIPTAILNSPDNRLPYILNIFFPGVDAELLVLRLDAVGISASAGSACLDNNGSQVIKEIFKDDNRARSSLRLSFGRDTIKADINRIIKLLPNLVELSYKL